MIVADAQDPVLAGVAAGLGVGLFRTTIEGWFVAGNDALVDLFGAASFDELRAVPVRDLYARPSRRTLAVERARAGEELPTERIEMRRLDGSPLWVRVRSRAVRDHNGEVAFLDGMLEDVTELARADLELNRSQALLATVTAMQNRYLAGGDPGALFSDVLDTVMATLRADDGIIADLQHAADGPVLRSWATTSFGWDARQRRLTLPDGRLACELPTTGNPLAHVLESGGAILSNSPASPRSGLPPTPGELRNVVGVPITRAGRVVGVIAVANRDDDFDDWAIDYLEPVATATGSLIAAAAADRDRRAAQRRELDTVAFARRIVEQAADAIVVVEDNGLIVEANAAAGRLFDTAATALIGTPVRGIVPREHGGGFRDRIMTALSARESLEVELRTVRGQPRTVEITMTRTHVDGRDVTVFIGRDVGARKELESALLRAKDAAESAVRHKDDLLAGMSHELRTPLNAVIGLASILGRRIYGPLTDRQSEYVAQIESSGRHLLGVITDILDAAKSDAGGVDPQPEPVAVTTVVDAAVDVVRELAAEQALTIDVDVPDELPDVCADARRTSQVLINLLGNAVKFTGAGGRIGIRAAVAGGDVAVTVWDTGIGIADHLQEAVFEPFVQVDASLARRYGGTGLGLALSRRIARAQGGDITVDSALEAGSRFTVTIPIAAPNAIRPVADAGP